MRYFNCQAAEGGSGVGVAAGVGEANTDGSGVAVSVAIKVRVASGGGASVNTFVDGAADDGAPHALNISSTANRLSNEVFIWDIILYQDLAGRLAGQVDLL